MEVTARITAEQGLHLSDYKYVISDLAAVKELAVSDDHLGGHTMLEALGTEEGGDWN
jgi:hypothetical protein